MAGELEDIGTRLREERDRVGISQRELARRIGLSASMISQIESGQSKPSVSTLYAIVTELGVSVDDIFRGHEDHAAISGRPRIPNRPMPALSTTRSCIRTTGT